MYNRFFILVSVFLFTQGAATFLVNPASAFVSRRVAFVLVVVVLVAWVIGLLRFFWVTPMSRREILEAWLMVGFLFCMLAGMQWVSAFVYRLGFYVILAWHIFWFALAGAFLFAASCFIPKRQLFPPSASYTVESVSPDHVTTVDGA